MRIIKRLTIVLIKKMLLVITILLLILPLTILIPLAFLFDKFNRYVDIAMFVAYVPFKIGDLLRYYFYKHTIHGLGKNTIFKFGSFCHYRNISIGNNVLIGYHTVLSEVEIGNDVLFGSHILTLSGNKQHSFDNPNLLIREHPNQRVKIKIGNDIWIGSKSIIVNDINDRSIIAAGSVVIKKVEKHTIVGGNPAKILKSIY